MHSNAIFSGWLCSADPNGSSHKYVNISSPTTAAAITENNENISIKIKIKINSAKPENRKKVNKIRNHSPDAINFYKPLLLQGCGDWGLSNRLSRLCHRPCHCQPVLFLYQFSGLFLFGFSCVLCFWPAQVCCNTRTHKTEQTQFRCMTMTLLKVPHARAPAAAPSHQAYHTAIWRMTQVQVAAQSKSPGCLSANSNQPARSGHVDVICRILGSPEICKRSAREEIAGGWVHGGENGLASQAALSHQKINLEKPEKASVYNQKQ